MFSRKPSAVPRLPVDRAFSIKGFGTVVTGTLIAGELKSGDEIEVLPGGVRTRVRNLQVHGHDTERALAGQRTAINLQGLNVEQGERGSVLAPAGRLRSTSMIDARLDLLKSAPRPLVAARASTPASRHGRSHGSRCDAASRARLLVRATSNRARAARSTQARRALTALPGDRFIIRSYSPQVTIGGGVIIDGLPEKHRIRDRRPAHGWNNSNGRTRPSARVFIEMAGARGMNAGELAARTGATDEQIADFARELQVGPVIEVASAPLLLLSTESYDLLLARGRIACRAS